VSEGTFCGIAELAVTVKPVSADVHFEVRVSLVLRGICIVGLVKSWWDSVGILAALSVTNAQEPIGTNFGRLLPLR